MTSRCHILEAWSADPGRYAQMPGRYTPEGLEDTPEGLEDTPEGLEEIRPKAWKKLASSGISSRYLTLTDPIHLHSEGTGPLP